MDITLPVAALFDLDGVILDTESQYSIFWRKQGQTCLSDSSNFEQHIKGMTLKEILELFHEHPGVAERICNDLNEYEAQMHYPYIPGVVDFIKSLRKKNIRTAVVTSSNDLKMQNVYRAHPEFISLFDKIFTAEHFKYSKPDPYCYLLGARTFATTPANCLVFEDSFHGLEAGNRAGMTVIGLSTTNSVEAIRDKAKVVIPDFRTFNVEKMLSLLR